MTASLIIAGCAITTVTGWFLLVRWRLNVDQRAEDAQWRLLEIAHEEEVPRWHAALAESRDAAARWHAHRGPLPALAVLDVWEIVLAWVVATVLGPESETEPPAAPVPAPVWADREPFALWEDDAYVTSRAGA